MNIYITDIETEDGNMEYGLVYFLLKFAAAAIKFIIMLGIAVLGISAGKKLRDRKSQKA